MPKKNKLKKIRRSETSGYALSPFAVFPHTLATGSSDVQSTYNFDWVKTKSFKSVFIDMLVAGASFFFVNNLYCIVVDSLSVKVNSFLELVIIGYTTYILIKILRD